MQGVLVNFLTGGGSPAPVDILVTRTVPAGSGLSSSAAMVLGTILAFLAINGKVWHFSLLPYYFSLEHGSSNLTLQVMDLKSPKVSS